MTHPSSTETDHPTLQDHGPRRSRGDDTTACQVEAAPERTASEVMVVVVGQAPEKARDAVAVLDAGGFTVIGVVSDADALSTIADHEGLLAVVVGGSPSLATRRRLRAAAPASAVIIYANIEHGKPADRFRAVVLPLLEVVRTLRTSRTTAATDQPSGEGASGLRHPDASGL